MNNEHGTSNDEVSSLNFGVHYSLFDIRYL
jgi:hypothetical protein